LRHRSLPAAVSRQRAALPPARGAPHRARLRLVARDDHGAAAARPAGVRPANRRRAPGPQRPDGDRMSGYLQRLVDSAAPASEPPPLVPVVKSTSPVFEQNQLFGLLGLEGGDRDAEIAPPLIEEPGPPDQVAPAARSVFGAPPRLDLPHPEPWPDRVAASPDPEVGRVVAPPLAPRPAAVDPITVARQPPRYPPVEPALPDRVVLERVPPFKPVPRSDVEQADPSAPPPAEATVFTPVMIENLPNEPEPPVARTAPPQAHAEPGSPERIVLRDVAQTRVNEAPRLPEPVEAAPAPPPASVLEPRPRHDFRDVEPNQDQAAPAPPQAPQITIGRVIVELVPDPAPVARSAPPARTAAAASVIGPLGNRRMRRRLFALSRL